MSMWIARQQVSCVGEADGDASVTSIRYILEDLRPHWLLPIFYVGRRRLFTILWKAIFGAKVVFSQLLDELGVVEDDRSGLLLLLKRDSLCATATAKIRARLFRLAKGLVEDVPFVDALGLHSSNPRQDVQDLFITLEDDLSVEIQLVHGEKDGAALGEASIDMQFPLVRMRRRPWGR
jgi:hypothetical protein